MAGVLLERISRVYSGGVTAVDEIDLEVYDREFLVLVGPSGSGKSTTLRMIAGLEPVSSGRILIGGQDATHLAPQRRNVAMVFQSQALYPHLSVYQNLAFGLELRRRGGSWMQGWLRSADDRLEAAAGAGRVELQEIEKRVRTAAGQLGIETLLKRMPGELSGGERQRVALGRALVQRPAAFLFDEPLSNLDAQLRVELRRELKKLARECETTMIYVTHDQAEALTLGDRIAVLRQGKLQQVGAPGEVYDRPANRFVAGFIGAPPMNLVEGKLVGSDGAGLRFAGSGWLATVASEHRDGLARGGAGGVVFGIRPEHVRLAEPSSAGAASEAAGPVLPARAVAVESLGDAKLVELDLSEKADRGEREAAGRTIWCKVDPRCRVGLGDQVRIGFDMQRAHWFAAATGCRLGDPRGSRG